MIILVKVEAVASAFLLYSENLYHLVLINDVENDLYSSYELGIIKPNTYLNVNHTLHIVIKFFLALIMG